MLVAWATRAAVGAEPAWAPVPGRIMTQWAADVSPEKAHPEYPRPTLVRKEWLNLNGLWEYAIASTNSGRPAQYQGKILVPFPVESALSGVQRMVGGSNTLWYRRNFNIPSAWNGRRVRLNFGAVDWRATIWINGKLIGRHEGGYEPFTFDVTDALQSRGDDELVVAVWDPSDQGTQPRGKQVSKPGGIWYTPTTGIWQTPWLEPVNGSYIQGLKITPDLDGGLVQVTPVTHFTGPVEVRVRVLDGNRVVAEHSEKTAGQNALFAGTFDLRMAKAKTWSPDSPFLYDLEATVRQNGAVVDSVKSYFGMRKISLKRDEQGILRMQLNNKTLFQYGPLDQGFWPDGLYTAPTDDALRWDIEMLKKLGFNMARKHVKIEPERWYYWCDKLGLLVWQDMPSGDKSAHWQGPSGFDGEEMQRTPESAAIYQHELKGLLDSRYNHPCIVVWVPFNEGWGQFDTVRTLDWVTRYDPSRLVDGASGGNHFPAGHIVDHHQYPGPGAPVRVTDRAMVLGEFGGLGLPIKDHTWQDEKNWGYRTFKTREEVTAAYLELLAKLRVMIEPSGLSAAIYTQTTDVEAEVNGLFTYDRKVVKMDEPQVTAANKALH